MCTQVKWTLVFPTRKNISQIKAVCVLSCDCRDTSWHAMLHNAKHTVMSSQLCYWRLCMQISSKNIRVPVNQMFGYRDESKASSSFDEPCVWFGSLSFVLVFLFFQRWLQTRRAQIFCVFSEPLISVTRRGNGLERLERWPLQQRPHWTYWVVLWTFIRK